MEDCSCSARLPGLPFPDCPLPALLAVEGVPCTSSSWMDLMSALGGRPRIPRRVLWTQSSLSLQYAICLYGIKNFSDYLKNKCSNEMAQLKELI